MRARDDRRMERPLRWRDRDDPTAQARIATATRKAKYGHRDWLYWTDRQGGLHVEPTTVASITQAMLDTGTQYCFTEIAANTGHLHIMSWPLALNRLRWAKQGGTY